MRGGCTRRIVPSRSLPCDLSSGEVACNGVSMGHRPPVVSPGRGGQCVGRSQVAVAWCAVTDVLAVVGFFGCDVPTVPISGASRRGLWAGSLEAAPRDLGHRGGVAIDRHVR